MIPEHVETVVGPSGAQYPVEPLRFTFGLTRVQMVDAHLHTIVQTGKNREDTDTLLDARLRYGGTA